MKIRQIVPFIITLVCKQTQSCLSPSRLKEMRLHPDEGEVVELRQALVADAAEFLPDEWRESVLCCGPINCLRTEVPSHEEICYLHEEKQTNT